MQFKKRRIPQWHSTDGSRNMRQLDTLPQEAEKRQEVRPYHTTSVSHTRDPLPATRHHCLMVLPSPSETVPPAGDQVFRDISHPDHNSDPVEDKN